MPKAPAAGAQFTAPQSGKAGPDRDRRNQLEGQFEGTVDAEADGNEVNPVGIVDGNMRTHDGQTAHPGINQYPSGPGGVRQDTGGDINSDELDAHKFVAGVSTATAIAPARGKAQKH